MLSPYKIKWNGYSSLEFDLWAEIAFDSDSGETETHLSRDARVSEAYNGTLKRAHSYRWNESFTFTITFVKQNYGEFTPEENRKILRWLTGSPNASFVDIYKDDSEVVVWSALGNWTNVSQYKLANNRIVGYVAEWESLTPWALSPLKTVTQDVSDPRHSTITINVNTDEPQSPVYPRITINQNSVTCVVQVDHALKDTEEWLENTVYYYDVDKKYYWMDAEGIRHISDINTSGFDTTSVVITNTYVDNLDVLHQFSSKVKNNIKGETVVLDGANRVVSSSRLDGRIFGDDFINWTWLPLCEGKNELSVIGNCTITIEWREPIKTGEF
jgi:hypothetical protein